MTIEKTNITIEATINASPEKTWQLWTDTHHIIKWNSASPEWHTPTATHDLKPGGSFLFRMEARDGSFGFDFAGVYDVIKPYEKIEYTLGDGRKVKISFINNGTTTKVVETFETETENSVELQRDGWQAILNNFKKYAETN